MQFLLNQQNSSIPDAELLYLMYNDQHPRTLHWVPPQYIQKGHTKGNSLWRCIPKVYILSQINDTENQERGVIQQFVDFLNIY